MTRYLLKKGLPRDTFLNINVPNVSEEKIASYKITHQGRTVHGNEVIEKVDPRGKKYYWIGGGTMVFNRTGSTDFEAISNSYISITPLHIDLTHYPSISKLTKWKL